MSSNYQSSIVIIHIFCYVLIHFVSFEDIIEPKVSEKIRSWWLITNACCTKSYEFMVRTLFPFLIFGNLSFQFLIIWHQKLIFSLFLLNKNLINQSCHLPSFSNNSSSLGLLHLYQISWLKKWRMAIIATEAMIQA